MQPPCGAPPLPRTALGGDVTVARAAAPEMDRAHDTAETAAEPRRDRPGPRRYGRAPRQLSRGGAGIKSLLHGCGVVESAVIHSHVSYRGSDAIWDVHTTLLCCMTGPATTAGPSRHFAAAQPQPGRRPEGETDEEPEAIRAPPPGRVAHAGDATPGRPERPTRCRNSNPTHHGPPAPGRAAPPPPSAAALLPRRARRPASDSRRRRF